MNCIIAIIQPSALDAVQERLGAMGVSGMTVSEVRGYGRQRGKREMYRGTEYSIDFLPKIRLEIAVPEDQAEDVVDCIASTCSTGKIGDGKIFTLPLSGVTRVRTGETGVNAL